MRQTTLPEQTDKLIELGFERPKSVTEISWQEDERDNPIINANTIEYTRHYSIGELLSFLPPKIWDDYAQIYWELCIDWDIIGNVWRVVYFHKALMRCYGEELIDALFDMVLRLKEEGVV